MGRVNLIKAVASARQAARVVLSAPPPFWFLVAPVRPTLDGQRMSPRLGPWRPCQPWGGGVQINLICTPRRPATDRVLGAPNGGYRVAHNVSVVRGSAH